MFQKEKSLLLLSSASPFVKNLASIHPSEGPTNIAVSHKNQINIIALDDAEGVCKQKFIDDDKERGMEKDIITQVKWEQFQGFSALVVTTHRGIKVYQSDAEQLIFSYEFAINPNEYSETIYARGIASIEVSSLSFICIGTFSGQIMKLAISGNNGKANDVVLCENKGIIHHKRPICDLASRDNLLASSDDTGIICIWDQNPNKSDLELKSRFEGYNGYPCTCLCIYKGVICAGYGSGHLRIFDMTKKFLICEISAHAKWITAIDITLNGLVLSTSEDSFVRIWQITEDEDKIRVNNRFGFSLANNMLFGGTFLNAAGSAFCVIGYDSVEVHRFTM